MSRKSLSEKRHSHQNPHPPDCTLSLPRGKRERDGSQHWGPRGGKSTVSGSHPGGQVQGLSDSDVAHQSPLCTTARPRGQEPFSLLWMDSVASGREKIGKVPQVSWGLGSRLVLTLSSWGCGDAITPCGDRMCTSLSALWATSSTGVVLTHWPQ